MGLNDRLTHRVRACAAWPPLVTLAACMAGLAGCSVIANRESPLDDVTRGSPTVVDLYRSKTGSAAGIASGGDNIIQPKLRKQQDSPRQLLRTQAGARPVADGDGDTRRYWSALEPMRQRFARVPNPDLVMVVYPHLARGQYPVPGYVTVFPMYEQAQYALPGEVADDLLDGRALHSREGR